MIQYSVVTEQPDSEPVTLTEAKTHLEYTGTAKDSYINSLIKSARRICEAYSGLSFVTQEREIKLDRFPCNSIYIVIPYGPVQAILSFTYLKDDGTEVTLVEGTDFDVSTVRRDRLTRVFAIDDNDELTTWPTDVRLRPEAITITYQTGYDNVSGEVMPEQIKEAILLQVASMFENRQDEQAGASSMINWNSMTILDTIKVTWNAHID